MALRIFAVRDQTGSIDAVDTERLGVEAFGDRANLGLERLVELQRSFEVPSVEAACHHERERQHGVGAGDRAVGLDVDAEIEIRRTRDGDRVHWPRRSHTWPYYCHGVLRLPDRPAAVGASSPESRAMRLLGRG